MADHAELCNFDSLKTGALGVSAAYGTMLAESAAVCLHTHSHPARVPLLVEGVTSKTLMLVWGPLPPQHKGTYADMQDTTEYGAYGLAIVLATRLTGAPKVERSVKGTGFDYWLGNGDELLFQRAARLEVSGILIGDTPQISARVKQKLAQTKPTDATGLPAYVAIVEFGKPIAHFVKKNLGVS